MKARNPRAENQSATWRPSRLAARWAYAPPGSTTTAEPFSWPGCGAKIVSVGTSSQALPFAWGASPGHRRMVWMPRKALSSPEVEHGSFCATADAQNSRHTDAMPTRRFTMDLDCFRRDYSGTVVRDRWSVIRFATAPAISSSQYAGAHRIH